MRALRAQEHREYQRKKDETRWEEEDEPRSWVIRVNSRAAVGSGERKMCFVFLI